MKSLKTCFIIFFISVVFTGCSGVSTETANRIARPENMSAPLQGTWKVEEYFTQGTGQGIQDSGNKWIGKTAGFTGSDIAFGDYYWSNVSYKIKRVNAEEYFLHKYKDAIKSFGIKDREIDVITASSEDKFLYEFVKVGEDRIIVSIDSDFYRLEKISPEFDGAAGGEQKNLYGTAENKIVNSRQPTHSGLLLGVRIPLKPKTAGKAADPDEYRYLTYWVSSVSGELRPVIYAESIFLPRIDGFWRLEVQKNYGYEGIEDFISASMVSGSLMKQASLGLKSSTDTAGRVESKLRRAILYVGNDYVCVENTEYVPKADSTGTSVKKVLRTLPIDNISNTEGIKLSDLTGGNGTTALEDAISEMLNVSGRSMKAVDEDKQEENFALVRKTGHWFFKGRLNLAQDEPLPFVDFNINLIPPSDMVAYDMLHIPWTAIKDRIPQAVDAYTSPNKDIAVILTRSSMMIYTMNAGAMSDAPVKKIKIPDGSSVVMAEWATGGYVLNWEKTFYKSNAVTEAETE